MKVDDIVHIKPEYLAYCLQHPGIILRIKDGMASVRILGGETVITVRTSILEVFREKND